MPTYHAHERHEHILAQLGALGSVKTRQLIAELGTSEETIRQDLIRLESLGQLKRVHGGAAPVGLTRYALPLPEREALHREEKALIAKRACELIQPRDSCFLDASSTVLAMTAFYPDTEGAVITNANHVIASLSHREHLDLVCVGGDYERRSRSYIGLLAADAVKRFLIHRMFIGVDGWLASRGASEVNAGQASLKERILPLAEEVIVLADASKLGRKSAFFFAETSKIHTLITNRPRDPKILDDFRKQGVRVLVVD
jgi:DeoR/GlpR family transcriptional regulator of sugar metabolism